MRRPDGAEPASPRPGSPSRPAAAYLKEGSLLLRAGGLVPPGLQGVPCSSARGGHGELGRQGWAAGRRTLPLLLHRLELPQQLPRGDLAGPQGLTAGPRAGGRWPRECPGPRRLGRGVWCRRPKDALELVLRVLSPGGTVHAAGDLGAAGRPWPRGVSTGPTLGQLCQRLQVRAPDQELLNGGTELLLDRGRASPGFLVGQGADDPLPNRKLLLLLLVEGLWRPRGFVTRSFVQLPEESRQGQVLGFRV